MAFGTGILINLFCFVNSLEVSFQFFKGLLAITCCDLPAATAQTAAATHPAGAAHPAAAVQPAGAAHPAAAAQPAGVAHPAALEVSREQCNSTYLLNLSAKGRALLGKYQGTEKYIPKADVYKITKIVVDEFLDRFLKINPTELTSRAKELSSLFPSISQVS